jgi:Spy/CpxP family protein refolding chaperone
MILGRKIVSVLTLAIAIITFNTFVTAQDAPANKDKNSFEKQERKGRFGGEGKRGMGEGKRGMRGNRGLMRSLSRLELTDSQKTQIKTILETTRSANQPFRDEAKTLLMKKRDGTITEAEQARLGEIKTQMKSSSEQTKNSVLATLTPTQLQKLEEMKAERQQRKEERRLRWQERRQDKSDQPAKPEDN